MAIIYEFELKSEVRNVFIAISLGKSLKSGKPNNFVLDKNFYSSLIEDQNNFIKY
jgi:hypothetical protein